MKQSQKKGKSSQMTTSYTRACPICMGRFRAGYDDGTEGFSHTFNHVTKLYEVCSKCDGEGVIQR